MTRKTRCAAARKADIGCARSEFHNPYDRSADKADFETILLNCERVHSPAISLIAFWARRPIRGSSVIAVSAGIAALAAGPIFPRDTTAATRTAFASFKFAKFLYLGPFLFGYVPGFSLNGSTTDIIKSFILIIIGTYAYSWFLSGIWFYKLTGNYPKKVDPKDLEEIKVAPNKLDELLAKD